MPAPTYFTVPDHIRQARKENINSLKKGNNGFQALIDEAKHNLRELLSIPATHQIILFDEMENALRYISAKPHTAWKDASGEMPFVQLDFKKHDAIVFPVNDGFGIPSKMTVVIQRNGSSNELLSGSGPDTQAIYLLAKVSGDLQRRGLNVLRQETDYKFAVLSQMIRSHPALGCDASDADMQSKTIISAKIKGGKKWLIKLLEAKKLTACIDESQGDEETVYFINYPAHSKELIEMLSDVVMAYTPPSPVK